MTGLRIVVGADDAGVEYKNILRRDLEADERVTTVVGRPSRLASRTGPATARVPAPVEGTTIT